MRTIASFLIPTAPMANQGVEDLERLEFDTSVYYFDSIISKNNTNEFTFNTSMRMARAAQCGY